MLRNSRSNRGGCDVSGRITMQDIADALGLSRNTVSKAINNTGVIAESTKDLILKKAVEMGYINPAGVNNVAAGVLRYGMSPALPGKKEIAMLTSSMPSGSHFAVTTLDRMQQIFSAQGYSVAYYQITHEELSELRLPGNLDLDKIAALFCIELFDYDYCNMLVSLGVPLLLIDGPVRPDKGPLAVDTLIMENFTGIHAFVRELAAQGKKSVGFVGNINHCRSFFERGNACIAAAAVNGLPPAEEYSILSFPPGPPNSDAKKPTTYANFTNALFELLQKLPALPEVFICANDFIAIHLIDSLRRMNIRCPEDILVMGFDDSPESRFHTPPLSTVHIHTQSMGRLAAELILSRIVDPSREPRDTYSHTDLILRESSRF